jgi:ubiquinone/menaquinone biosynthesis C-methylase UbiE
MEIPASLKRAALAIVAGAILIAAPYARSDLRAERVGGQAQQQGGSHGRLFPPSDLGLLEAPDRDLWQRPDQIMDAMGIADASVVADIGAGSGWFTIRLARRVGPRGLVYAEDVQRVMIDAISRRAGREGLANVKPVLGRNNDPSLPVGSIDAALMVDAYHEIENRVAVLSNLARALKPQGRIGVIDFKLDGTGPGPSPEERVSPDVVVKDAAQAGLRLIRQEPFLEYQYFLVFGK